VLSEVFFDIVGLPIVLIKLSGNVTVVVPPVLKVIATLNEPPVFPSGVRVIELVVLVPVQVAGLVHAKPVAQGRLVVDTENISGSNMPHCGPKKPGGAVIERTGVLVIVIVFAFEFDILVLVHVFLIEPTTVTTPPFALVGSSEIILTVDAIVIGPLLVVPNSLQPAGIVNL